MQTLGHKVTAHQCSWTSVPLHNGIPTGWIKLHPRSLRAAPDNKTPQITEDVLERLRQAEEEAAKLRKQLAQAQAVKGAPAAEVMGSKPKRIDSRDARESPFVTKERSSWLSEADVDFFVGTGVGETPANVKPMDEDAQATVQRRLLIGLGLSAAAGALALVPTEAMRPKPPKPLYFYVVPLLRIQALLSECGEIIEDANWDQLRLVLSRVQGSPNNALRNLENCVALLEDSATRTKAQQVAQDLNEYLDAMDYNSYFDAIPVRQISGAQNAEFVKFSRRALMAAQQKLTQFLKFIPYDVMEQAVQANTI